LTGLTEPSCGIPLLLNPPPDRCSSCSIGLGGPLASPRWRFYGFRSRLGSNEKVNITLSASKRVRRRPLGLICVFSHGPVQHEAASSPSWASLRTPVYWILELGSGGSSPRALLGSVGVDQISCVTPSVVSATGGAELTTLASMTRVSRSVSSLTGMFEWNPGLSFADGVGIALMWHSTAP